MRRSGVRFRGQTGKHMLGTSFSAFDPGCVKTHTSAKCGKYNSPTRYRAVCAQHDLALMMRNFSEMFLRPRRALEFSHGQDPEPTSADRRHSITSSARASTCGGISRPSALAVLRLSTVSYLVGACTGRFAGFS